MKKYSKDRVIDVQSIKSKDFIAFYLKDCLTLHYKACLAFAQNGKYKHESMPSFLQVNWCENFNWTIQLLLYTLLFDTLNTWNFRKIMKCTTSTNMKWIVYKLVNLIPNGKVSSWKWNKDWNTGKMRIFVVL